MYAQILVPVDGSPTSDLGLAEATKLAKLTGAHLRLMHAVDMLSLSLTPEAGMAATPSLFELLREGGQAILTRAKAEVDKSSDAEQILRLSPVPVLLVRAKEA